MKFTPSPTVLTDLEIDSGTFSIDATNNRVGVGTTAPDGALHVMKASAGSVTASGDGNILVVENSDVAGMTLLSPNDGVIYFGDVGDNDIGRIVYKHSDDSMNLWTNNAVQMTIESGGNVGVGIASPSTKLTVEGAVTLKEQAAADADTAAYGQLWIKNEAPCELYFTTDAGDDIQLTDGTSAAGGGGTNNDVDLILHMALFS